MQKMKKDSHHNVRVLALSAVLAAMSIVCGKYLAFNLGQFIRISFENLPILLGGMLFGPVAGALIGAVADLVGCVLVGYAINPMVTLGAVSIGALGGTVWHIVRGANFGVRVWLSAGIAHLVGSVTIKTLGLAVFYDMPFWQLLLWRLLNYLLVGSVEGALLCAVMKNKAVASLQRRYGAKRGNEREI